MIAAGTNVMVAARDLAHARVLASLVEIRDEADHLAAQVCAGDHSGVRASAYELASRLSDVASYCPEHGAVLAHLHDLATEAGLVKEVGDAIQSALAAVTITPAVDYDLSVR